MLEIRSPRGFQRDPVIDIGTLGSADAAEREVVQGIRDASMHVGFLYLTNHGIGPAETRGMFGACNVLPIPQVRRDELYLVNSSELSRLSPIACSVKNTSPTRLLESSISEWSWAR